jgi:hypothetical protein
MAFVMVLRGLCVLGVSIDRAGNQDPAVDRERSSRNTKHTKTTKNIAKHQSNELDLVH